jgi:hypothetical protein
MVQSPTTCRHRWERRSDEDLWCCRLCGTQQLACPHPSWRSSAIGSGYVCGWCGVEPEGAGDAAVDEDEPARRGLR